MPRVLIIDDDTKLLKLLSEYLPRYRISAETETDPRQALENLAQIRPDIVILDIQMPGMDGFEVCRQIRQTSDLPILMLSARGDSTDKILGLELGADDYMSKPFDPRELVSRINSILRRSYTPPDGENRENQEGPLKSGDLIIYPTERRVILRETPLDLTSMEYELLLLFLKNPGKKLSRDEIAQVIQGGDASSYSRSIDIVISRLRAKLGENARAPRYIQSIHGFGYVFTGTVQ